MGCLDLEQYKRQAVDAALKGFSNASGGYIPNGLLPKLFELICPVVEQVMGSTFSSEMGIIKSYDLGFKYSIELKPLR